MYKLLLVDDSPIIYDLISSIFFASAEVSFSGHCDDIFNIDAETLLSFDGFIVDYHMPSFSGLDVHAHFTSLIGEQRPFFLLTQDERLALKVRVLKTTITDFLSKEMPDEEIKERVLNKLQRNVIPRHFKWRSLSFDNQNLTCCEGDRKLQLTTKELLTVKALVENGGKLSRADLIEAIWKSDHVLPSTLNTHIYNLNKKFQSHRILQFKQQAFVQLNEA